MLEAEKHPDADRLTVCSVDVAGAEPQTIVCGAPNVAAGQTVAVALPGAIMPDGTELGEAKLRGVRSAGMILAEDEVGIGEDHDGTMVLDERLPIGAPLAEHLPIVDEVLELEVTPNRPDTMAVYGVARDLHAVTGAPLAPDPTDADAEPRGDDTAADHIAIEIDPEVCLRFTARVYEDVTIGPSPLWLKQRLMAAGQRPISNVVDITNYVMLCTGQPLHAFDLDEVRGGRIVVRRATEGETMTTLDDVERRFSSEVALVCDGEGPTGIAGIMGGLVSEVSDKTTRVLMEAATWVGPNIMRTSKALGLRTEASARFEKQLHPEQAIAAQRLAARLMVELCGARMVPGTVDVYPEPAPPRVVGLRRERIERLLGADIEPAPILERLGFEPRDGAWQVPPWRDSDVQREADLIEEVARVHGLGKLPTTLPARRGSRRGPAHPQPALAPPARGPAARPRAARVHLLQLHLARRPRAPAHRRRARAAPGEPAQRGAGRDAPAAAAGPARRRALQRRARAARGGAVRVGPLLLPARAARRRGGGLARRRRAGAGAPAPRRAAHRGRARRLAQPRPAGRLLRGARACSRALLEAAGLPWWAEEGPRPYLHPGRAASVLAGNENKIGWLGELHPLVAREWDLAGPVAAFELDVDAMLELGRRRRTASYGDVTSFPAVLQDIAVVVEEEVPAAEVEEAVRTGGGELLRDVAVFDLYRGEQVGEGNKSLALRLEFRAPDRTLTDDEVAERRTAIEAALADLGGRLRA